ncbi:hypothetical protein [Nannocystis punicea]|uniref:Uncharacterized protein n=1 Tax=Nannocystis punicea TaxID=2995304 RepID=A0ABY7GUD0_9BACT|nr:hypothetical protein [Nannocystis poenicansa]WAS90558.1 hypothetical protein O0S08_30595 [Nannocystis poenicansa]
MWQCTAGEWIVALCELGRDDEDFGNTLDVAFAWEDGHAVMITPYRGAATRIPAVSGIPWPEKLEASRRWYGE